MLLRGVGAVEVEIGEDACMGLSLLGDDAEAVRVEAKTTCRFKIPRPLEVGNRPYWKMCLVGYGQLAT